MFSFRNNNNYNDEKRKLIPFQKLAQFVQLTSKVPFQFLRISTIDLHCKN